MNNNQDRKWLLQQIEETLTLYCNGCFLHRYHRKEFGKSYAHEYCLSSCTVGEQLRQYGDKLKN